MNKPDLSKYSIADLKVLQDYSSALSEKYADNSQLSSEFATVFHHCQKTIFNRMCNDWDIVVPAIMVKPERQPNDQPDQN